MKPLFVTTKPDVEDRFAIKLSVSGKTVNFWHNDGKNTYLYTFLPTDRYSHRVVWCDRICRELLEDLRQPKPSVQVVRFAVNGMVIFSDIEAPEVPAMPTEDEAPQITRANWDSSALRAEMEYRKGSEPAPYILYGKFSTRAKKEFSWKLTPDKACRQGIWPGYTVVVWTRYGFGHVIVTRIEEAGDQPEPQFRVKRKLTGKEIAALRAKYKKTPPDET